jgi:predicted Ser/Thr protein kinase
MSDDKKCAQCGAPLPAGVPEGLCPACLLKRGFETQTAAGAPAADFTPPPPEELARYFPQLEILELLGRGGMGVVYKARQPQLDRLVALKILPSAADRDPAFAERFTREARALARLSHPNIVAVYDFGQTAGLFYFVMEYVDGLNLRQLQATARITPAEALAIVPQICEALQTAHDQGIVHRDIKPENILLDKKGRVKIADFGIAKIMGADERDMTLTAAGEVVGTPAYMAPEQIEHPRDVDHRADIYSLGVVFYQMLTGELPLGKFAPPSRKVHIDVRLDDVVLRALEKEPELRYQQASVLKTQVQTIVDSPRGKTEETREVKPEPKTSQDLDRVRLHLIIGAVLMAISAIAAGHYLAVYVQQGAGIAMAAWGVALCGAITVLAGTGWGDFEKIRAAAQVSLIDGIGIVAVVTWLAWNTSDLPAPWRVCLMLIFAGMIMSSCLKLACVWPYNGSFWTLDRREKQPLGYLAIFCAWLSGLIPTIFYWLAPWVAPWLTPDVQMTMLWVTLFAALSALIPGLGSRKSRQGRTAIIVGGMSLTIWLLFDIAGHLSAYQPAARGRHAESIGQEYDWQSLAASGKLMGGVPVKVDGRSALRIENTADAPLQLTLLKIEKPPITAMTYALIGEIKYESVQGAGYLEMWNYFPPLSPGNPEGQYFSRTLGAAGGGWTGQIAGTSSWRSFMLPFNCSGAKGSPTRLEFNIFLPGRGVVFVGPPKLTQVMDAAETTH